MMANSEGLADGMSPLEKKVTLHHSCHSRAQNMGTKSLEMLKLIPSIKINFVEKCSGHGGTFGVVRPTHKIAEKIGAKVAGFAFIIELTDLNGIKKISDYKIISLVQY